MKTIAVILIIFLVAGVVLFGTAVGKALKEPPEGVAGQPVVEEIPEISGSSPRSEIREEPEKEEPEKEEPEKEEPEEEEPEKEEPDPDAIAAIEIYLDGPRDEGLFLGEVQFGLTSKEAYSIYGERLSESGFLLVLDDSSLEFEPGSIHYLYIYTLIPKYGWEYNRQRVTANGDSEFSQSIELHIDSPRHDSVILESEKESLQISGWSADLSTGDSTGIERVEIYMNGPRNMGTFLGQAEYGLQRQDVAAAYANANYTNSGYRLIVNASGLEPGTENSIYVYSYSSKGTYKLAIRDITMEGEKGDSNTIMSVEVSLDESSVSINGWAVSKDDAQNTGPRDTGIEYVDKKIAFVSNKNGNEDIFIMDIDGTELTQLTDSINKDAYPVGSPDGKKIAYTSEIGGYWQVMVMDIDGDNKIQLTDDPVRSGYPTWSFDGRYIFYEAYSDGDWEIYRMNRDGSFKKRLTFNASSYDWHPFAHPFLYKVIFESGAGGFEKLFMMDYDGSNIQRLSSNEMRMRVPGMSVDGEYIVFMGEGENRYVYIMDGNGENIRLISQRPNSEHPHISPDNELISFNSSVDGQSEIFIINLDGSSETRITSIPGDDWGPSFIYQLP